MREELVLITAGFPFGGREQFLETEIKYLAAGFRRIYIIPMCVSGSLRSFPENVEIIEEFAKSNSTGLGKLLNLSSYPIVLRNLKFDCSYMKILLGWGLTAGPLCNFLIKFMNGRKAGKMVFYSYWFDYCAFSVAAVKKEFPELHVVTRAHGYDLYEKVHRIENFPLRRATLAYIDKVYTISEHGKKHLQSKHPEFREKIYLSKLGVDSPGFKTLPSADGKLRIVSCSFLVSVKRIELIIESLGLFRDTNYYVEWVHIGDGPLREKLERFAELSLGGNVKYQFVGQLDNKDVLEFYKIHQFDVFLNVSSSEGLPVSIMEAQSCSIPIIATNVGGTGEIVNNENGLLLSANPEKMEVFSGLINVIDYRERWHGKRFLSFQNWKKNYNAELNYTSYNIALKFE